MTTDTAQRIIHYIKKHHQASPKELYALLDIGPRAVFKQLQTLTKKNLIQKIGQAPKTYYSLVNVQTTKAMTNLDMADQKIIDENFYYISPLGQELLGWEGFQDWCHKQNLPAAKTAQEYIATIGKYSAYKKDGLIDGMQKISSTFEKVWLDQIFYLDFYAIERFGKTKLGQLLLLAKSNQHKKEIRALIETIAPSIQRIIKKFNIDAVGFIPPTVKREVQLMNELKKQLPIKPRLLSIIKVKTPIMVAQKTLNKLADRIENARQTIIVQDKNPFENILLIDDAVGSGATLNETAAIIKQKKLCKTVIGLAIVGSFKGFDVISEV